MANVRTFTDQEVLNAANKLQDEGKQVTANALRRIVGKGRPNVLFDTYTDLVSAGKAQLPTETGNNVVVMESYDLPSEIQEELSNALNAVKSIVTRCNDIAYNVLDSRLNKAMREAKDARINAENAIEEANKNETTAYEEAEALRIELDECSEVLATTKQTVVELTTKSDQFERDSISLNQTNTELKRELSIAQKAVSEEKQKTSQAMGKADQLNIALLETKSSIGEANEQIMTLTTTNAVIESGMKGANERLDVAEKQHEKDVEQIATLTANNNHLTNEIERLKQTVKDLSAKLNTKLTATATTPVTK